MRESVVKCKACFQTKLHLQYSLCCFDKLLRRVTKKQSGKVANAVQLLGGWQRPSGASFLLVMLRALELLMSQDLATAKSSWKIPAKSGESWKHDDITCKIL